MAQNEADQFPLGASLDGSSSSSPSSDVSRSDLSSLASPSGTPSSSSSSDGSNNATKWRTYYFAALAIAVIIVAVLVSQTIIHTRKVRARRAAAEANGGQPPNDQLYYMSAVPFIRSSNNQNRRKKKKIVLNSEQVELISTHTWKESDAKRDNLLPEDVVPIQEYIVNESDSGDDGASSLSDQGEKSGVGRSAIGNNGADDGNVGEWKQESSKSPSGTTGGAPTGKVSFENNASNLHMTNSNTESEKHATKSSSSNKVSQVIGSQSETPLPSSSPENKEEPSKQNSEGHTSVQIGATPGAVQRSHTINTLPEYTHETCAVCIDEFEEGDKLRVLPCGHGFHKECIDPWLIKKSVECPLCKSDVRIGLGLPIPEKKNEDGSAGNDNNGGDITTSQRNHRHYRHYGRQRHRFSPHPPMNPEARSHVFPHHGPSPYDLVFIPVHQRHEYYDNGGSRSYYYGRPAYQRDNHNPDNNASHGGGGGSNSLGLSNLTRQFRGLFNRSNTNNGNGAANTTAGSDRNV
ncbi:hypothetical protein H4219_006186 [Mycoemilia scoparia]|uniref:RING-type domain-containing protein n=1 Tax=Mycoemilia scoparia TaxID=417184 RepID=A0A9W7ZR22_9FUNG|nr:hypothetical protein H4219_006186 [Mycoemilia scoparia]